MAQSECRDPPLNHKRGLRSQKWLIFCSSRVEYSRLDDEIELVSASDPIDGVESSATEPLVPGTDLESDSELSAVRHPIQFIIRIKSSILSLSLLLHPATTA